MAGIKKTDKKKKMAILIIIAISVCLLFTFSFLAACSKTAVIEETELIEEILEKEEDSQPSEDFIDLKDTKDITINMKDISFDLPRIIIDSGTTVTWVNQDDVGHTVNSDPHPGHNNHPELNSDLLHNGDTFSFTFDETGLYTYHCSPHYSTMKGSVLVE